MKNDGETLRGLSDHGYGIPYCLLPRNRSQDGIWFPLGYHTNLYRASNQIGQMLIHTPKPASFLRVAAYDLMRDGQYKWQHGPRGIEVPYQNREIPSCLATYESCYRCT